jgi:hypothetical protein
LRDRPFEALRAFEGLRPFEALRAFESIILNISILHFPADIQYPIISLNIQSPSIPIRDTKKLKLIVPVTIPRA